MDRILTETQPGAIMHLVAESHVDRSIDCPGAFIETNVTGTYPISVLMLAGISEICIIMTLEDQAQFQRALGDGTQWGVSFTYVVQPSPDGLALANILAEDFLDGAPSAMVLGSNIFFGYGLLELLAKANERDVDGTVFGYHVIDPERYGVVDFDKDGRAQAIIEKPTKAPSNYAVTGL